MGIMSQTSGEVKEDRNLSDASQFKPNMSNYYYDKYKLQQNDKKKKKQNLKSFILFFIFKLALEINSSN